MTNEQFSEVITVLHTISQSLRVIAQRAGTSSAPTPGVASVAIASDSDLDGTYGNEEVRINPRDWSGASMKGQRMSDCPPEFLDMLAETMDYFAKKNAASGAMTTGGKPKADFDRKAAARARGWAARLRGGWTAPALDMGGVNEGAEDYDYGGGAPAGFAFATGGGDDDIPF